MRSQTAVRAAPVTPGGDSPIVRPSRLGDLVMSELIKRVASGRWTEGELLPTESELQAEFSVGRSALRDGLKAVEARGMIAIRQGRGAQVQPMIRWNLLDPDVLAALIEHYPRPDIFEQMMATRQMIEPELARHAATSVGTDDLERMSELLDRMTAARGDPESFLEYDVLFHRAIAEVAGNAIAGAIMASIERPLRSTRRLTNTLPRALERAERDHRAIYARLRAADPEGAAQAMRDHLEWSAQQMLRRWKSHPGRSARPS